MTPHRPHALRSRRRAPSVHAVGPLAAAIAHALRAPAATRTRAARPQAALLAGTLLLSLSITLPAQAQNWTGAVSSDWFDGRNWDNGQPPPSNLDGVLNTVTPNPTVIDGRDGTVRSLAIGGGPTLIGNLSILGGGTLQAGSVGAGSGGNLAVPGGLGIVTVRGVGSRLTASTVSGFGINTGTGRLFVLDGGVVEFASTVSNAIIFGFSEGGTGTAAVTGAGSTLITPGGLTFAQQGNAALTIGNGGVVEAGTFMLGEFAGGRGDASLDGSGSALRVSRELVVGGPGLPGFDLDGGTGALTLRSGAQASAGSIIVGQGVGSSGTVDVAGAGSRAATTGTVTVGAAGTGTLRIADGAVLASSGGPQNAIGLEAGSSGAATVTGAGSRWNASQAVIVGRNGTGSLVVSAAAGVSSSLGVVGDLAGSVGAATVTGAGSTWTMTGALFVGNFGRGTLDIGTGAAVTSGLASLGGGADAQGTATVSGADARWAIANAFNVGNLGTATVTISNGGAVSSGLVRLGLSAGGEGTVTVTGAGASLGNAGAMSLGLAGTGRVNVRSGGTVSTGSLVAGSNAGSDGRIEVTGTGSRLSTIGDMSIGNGGLGRLSIAAGGTAVTGGRADIGEDTNGDGSVAVSGAGSLWTIGGGLGVGLDTTGALGITGGGRTQVGGDVSIGLSAPAVGQVAVDGAGSTLDVAGDLEVGSAGTGSLVVSDGGQISARSGRVGDFSGTGDVRVFGAGSRLDLSGGLLVGDAGADATVTVSEGGVLTASGITLTDLGSGDTSIGTLNIGGRAGEAAAGAGTVDAPSLVFGAGTGTLNFNHTATDYVFDAALGGDGTLNHVAGTTRLTGAGDASGTLNVAGGTLRVEGTLGDMTTTVAGGATLGGSGSIAGDVTVQDGGILSPGSSAGTLTLGSLSLSSGSILDYELGQAGVIGGGVNDLIEIDGNLTLDGTLQVTDIGGFGAGVYRLMNYGGTLTDNGLDLGTLPTGTDAQDLFVQTAIGGQVNLVNSAGLALSFWDGSVASEHNNGAIDGGDGTWDAGNDNWTASDGAVNGRWDAGTFAVFGGAGGTVSIVGEQAVAGLQFMAGYTLEAGAGGTLRIDGADSVFRVDPTITATINAPITGAGGLVKTDTGTLVLSGINTYAGGTRIDLGTLQVGSDANLGAASGALAFDGGTLRNSAAFASARSVTLGAGGGTFDTAANLSLSGVIDGAGTFTKTGAGTFTLTGSNTYTGNTRVQDGTLVGDVDAIRGNLDNAGTVVFDQGSDATFAGSIAGSGVMLKRGAGVLALGGNSALDWSIDAGTLAARSAQFAGDAAIAAGATFRFSDATGTYAGVLSGAGRFELVASGSAPFQLTGNSAAFTGSTFLNAGTLRIDGALGGLTTVAAGATLMGTGTLGSVDNAGTLAPGNSIGTLTLTGNYVHRAGATLLAEIEPGGSSDLLDVAGTATLQGGTVDVTKAPGQYAGGTRYTLIDADGGVTGTFGALTQDTPFLDLALAYDANRVYLDVARSEVDFAIVCGDGSFNQCQVAGALDAIGDGEAITPDLEAVLTEVTTLGLDEARAGFDRLSGEAHASLAGAMLEGHALYGQTVTRRLVERREAEGADRLHGGAWVRGYGAGSELDGDGNAAGARTELYGIAAGVDAWATESWLLGASVNTLKVDADFREGDGGEADASNLALYTSVHGERAYFDAVGSYAWWDNEVERRIEVGDIARTARSDYGSHRFATYVEAGLTYALGRGTLQPLLSAEWSLLSTQNFREDGAGDVSLIGRSDSVERTVAGAGLRWTGASGGGAWTLAPTAQLRWLHTFGDLSAEFDVAFAGAPDVGYRVRGVTVPENRGLLGVGLLARRDALDLFVDADLQAGDGYEAASVSLGARWRW